MTSKKATKALLCTALFFLFLIIFFNWFSDPLCFYQCSEIDPGRYSLNSYYLAAQKSVVHDDAEIALVASSRGETTPTALLERLFALKAINLSVAGADFQTKRGFLRLAQKDKPLKKIIWLADYFEMIPGRTDRKMLNSEVLSLLTDFPKSKKWSLLELQSLIDHNTLEASMSFLKRKKLDMDQGSGGVKNLSDCRLDVEVADSEKEEELKKEVALVYQNYATSVLKGRQSAEELQKFKEYVLETSQSGALWTIWIAPYHPEFRRRLQIEHPDIWSSHLAWIRNLKEFASTNKVEILDFLSDETGFPDDSRYWNDGVHFNCRGVVKMLGKKVQ